MVRADRQAMKERAEFEKTIAQERFDRHNDRSDKEDLGFVAARNANEMACKRHELWEDGNLRNLVGEAIMDRAPDHGHSSHPD